ncbi:MULTISPECIES: L,D-transpeptidase [unclassified Bacillus (in: firmicutes)]|uniref:L,D-transpeptidase n=1 Tax=unclassified Bacillus (in: firmicutes) TaxID=185979 RepID=UPI000B841577|nr:MULTISPECIES: L,D-transpeptidase [unclassified Bacillus (in: firmicutes)]
MRKIMIALLLFFSSMLPIKAVNAETNQQDHLLVVNVATNKMAYYEKGKLIKEFTVATGKSSTKTPLGKYTIVNKIKNRPYYKRHIPGGDPRNPLGDRWLGLDVNGTKGTTYAIHGTNNANAIGKWTTLGCIRMYNDDVHWLFDRVPVNTTVIVTNK